MSIQIVVSQLKPLDHYLAALPSALPMHSPAPSGVCEIDGRPQVGTVSRRPFRLSGTCQVFS